MVVKCPKCNDNRWYADFKITGFRRTFYWITEGTIKFKKVVHLDKIEKIIESKNDLKFLTCVNCGYKQEIK